MAGGGWAPSATTQAATNITDTTATANQNGVQPGYPDTGTVYFCIGTAHWENNPYPLYYQNSFGSHVATSGASYSSNLSYLLPGTTYYVCSAGYNSAYNGYESEINFTTTGTKPALDQQQTTQNSDSSIVGNSTFGLQSFIPSKSGILYAIELYQKNLDSSYSYVPITICSDNSGTPNYASPLATSAESALSTTPGYYYGWIQYVLGTPLTVVAGTTYWIQTQTTMPGDLGYDNSWGLNSAGGYANGVGKYRTGSTITDATGDFCFKTYMTATSKIEGQVSMSGSVNRLLIGNRDINGSVMLSGTILRKLKAYRKIEEDS